MDGTVVPDLFPIRATGVSTEPIRLAAKAFLASLTDDQVAALSFPVDDIEWRQWSNVDGYGRVLRPRPRRRSAPPPDPLAAPTPEAVRAPKSRRASSTSWSAVC